MNTNDHWDSCVTHAGVDACTCLAKEPAVEVRAHIQPGITVKRMNYVRAVTDGMVLGWAVLGIGWVILSQYWSN
jgi:hypothetical protein